MVPWYGVSSVRELLPALVQVDRQDPRWRHHRQALQSAHHALRVKEWRGIMGKKLVYAGSDEASAASSGLTAMALIGADPKC